MQLWKSVERVPLKVVFQKSELASSRSGAEFECKFDASSQRKAESNSLYTQTGSEIAKMETVAGSASYKSCLLFLIIARAPARARVIYAQRAESALARLVHARRRRPTSRPTEAARIPAGVARAPVERRWRLKAAPSEKSKDASGAGRQLAPANADGASPYCTCKTRAAHPYSIHAELPCCSVRRGVFPLCSFICRFLLFPRDNGKVSTEHGILLLLFVALSHW